MKKIYFFLFALCSFYTFSQAPKLINYQGVVRSAAGNPIAATVKIKFEIFPSATGGTAAFSEIQSVTTNSLGLFSTRIGINPPLNLNWSTGSWYLELSVDTTNSGSSFVTLGRQQMVSVPFALYAENAGSAPAPSVTFSNNILYVGTNSVAIPAAPVYSAGSDIAITSGSIVNTAPDQTVNITAAGNASVISAYPNFTVGALPQVLSISNNVISLSNGGGAVTLPATSTTPNTSLTASGIATVTSSGTNTFNVAVASPTITGTGAITVSGTYPNFLINAPNPVTPTITGTGVASTSSSGNNFTVSVPSPSFTYASNTGILSLIQGSSTFNGNISPSATISGNTLSVGSSTVNLPFWNMNGNSNVLSGTNFLGTTNTTDLTFRTNNTPRMTILSGGNVGIGNTSPVSDLDIFNASQAMIKLGYSGSSGFYLSANSAAANILSYDNTPMNFGTTGINQMTLLQNGNFGVGTGGPISRIHARDVQATISVESTGSTGVTSYDIRTPGAGIGTLNKSNSTGRLTLGTGGAYNMQFLNSIGGSFQFDEGGSTRMYIATGGNIGIGTTTPGARLEIVNAAIGAVRIADGSQGAGKVFTSDGTGLGSWQLPAPTPGNGTANFLPKWNAGGNGLTPTSSFFDTGILSGVGTSAPSTRLHLLGVNNTTVVNAFSGSPETALRIHNADQTNNNFSSLIFSTDASNSSSFEAAKIAGVTTNHTAGTIAGDLVFLTRNATNLNEAARITSGGNVGIGTSAPVNRLHVSNGGVTINDGTEGPGKVLTSDPSGNASWKPVTIVTAAGFNNRTLANVSPTPTNIGPALASFVKVSPDTRVEVTVQTHIYVGDFLGTSAVSYEIRLNGTAPLSGTGRTNYFIDNNGGGVPNNYIPVSFTAEFSTLATGTYNVEVWVWAVNGGTSATNASVDSGNYSASSVIVKEFR